MSTKMNKEAVAVLRRLLEGAVAEIEKTGFVPFVGGQPQPPSPDEQAAQGGAAPAMGQAADPNQAVAAPAPAPAQEAQAPAGAPLDATAQQPGGQPAQGQPEGGEQPQGEGDVPPEIQFIQMIVKDSVIQALDEAGLSKGKKGEGKDGKKKVSVEDRLLII